MSEPVLTYDEWRDAARRGDAPEGVLRRGFASKVLLPEDVAASDDSRVLDFIISTPAIDRYSDVIEVEGWELDNYRANPVVLWAHDQWTPPIGKALEVWVEDDTLRSRAEFTDRATNPLGEQVYRLYKGGFLNAVSVGFRPLEWTFDEDIGGFRFKRQELVEYSAVPIPANPEALIVGRMAQEDVSALIEWAERAMEFAKGEPGLWLPRQTAEAVLRRLNNERTVHPVPDRPDAPAAAAPTIDPTQVADDDEAVREAVEAIRKRFPADEVELDITVVDDRDADAADAIADAKAVVVRFDTSELASLVEQMEALVERMEAVSQQAAGVVAPREPQREPDEADAAGDTITADEMRSLIRRAIEEEIGRATGRIVV